MHIAFAASECVPFSKTGGLADVVGALPRALAALGHQVTVYLPKYRQTKLIGAQTLIRSLTIPDRKSTRLNSSHLVISYAVFCLKKKKIHRLRATHLREAHRHDPCPHGRGIASCAAARAAPP